MISVLDLFLPVDLHRRPYFLFGVLARCCPLDRISSRGGRCRLVVLLLPIGVRRRKVLPPAPVASVTGFVAAPRPPPGVAAATRPSPGAAAVRSLHLCFLVRFDSI
jgi:hypothetical protein